MKVVAMFLLIATITMTFVNAAEEKVLEINYDLKAVTLAEADCVSRGGHLASINSKEDHDFIVGALGLWLDGVKQVTIGGQWKGASGKWDWTDATLWNYENFHSTVDPVTNKEYCLSLHKAGGVVRWNDIPCTNKYAYVCKIPK